MKLDAKDIANAVGYSSVAIRNMAKREDWPFEEIPSKGRGGRKRLYPVTQIPNVEIRRQLLKDNPYENPYAPAEIETGGAIRVSRELKQKYNPAEIPKPYQKLGKARADLVSAFVTERDLVKQKGLPIGATMDKWLEEFNAGRTLRVIGARIREHDRTPVTRRRMYEWISNMEKHGWTALCGYKKPHNKGRTTISETEMKLLLSQALDPKHPPITICARRVREKLQLKGLEVKSVKTYARWLKRWRKKNYDKWVAMREGEKAVRDKIVNYLERDYDTIEVGDVLVADGHVTNFKVLDRYTGKAKRMMLIMFYDMKSRMPLGWEIMPTESTQGIHSALFNAIMTLGKIPKAVILDNGKAFKSKVFIQKGDELDLKQEGIQGVYHELGIEDVIFAWPYNARAKTIERFFGSLNEFELLMPSYTGRNVDDKPATMKRNEKRLQKVFPTDVVYDVDQTNLALAHWIEHVYGNRPKRALNNRTPKEVFMAGKGPGVDPESLAVRMLFRDKAVVRNQSVSRFGVRYVCDDLVNIQGEVEIRFSLHDITQMYVFSEDGQYIGVAQSTHKHPPVVRGKDMETHKRFKADLAKQRRTVKMVMSGAEDEVLDLRGIADQFGMSIMDAALESADQLSFQPSTPVNLDQHFRQPSERLPDIVRMATELSSMKEKAALPPAEGSENRYEEVTQKQDSIDHPIFQWPFERYEWLLDERSERTLTDEEELFIREFEEEARKTPSSRECFGL